MTRISRFGSPALRPRIRQLGPLSPSRELSVPGPGGLTRRSQSLFFSGHFKLLYTVLLLNIWLCSFSAPFHLILSETSFQMLLFNV